MTTITFIKKITITTDDPNPLRPEVLDHDMSVRMIAKIPYMGNTNIVVVDYADVAEAEKRERAIGFARWVVNNYDPATRYEDAYDLHLIYLQNSKNNS